RDLVLDRNLLPPAEVVFNSLPGDSAGVAIPPRVMSIHWEDYGGVPGDLVSPPTIPGIVDCGQPWGTRGSAAGQFVDPDGVAVSASGIVYVVDSGNSRIQTFTRDGTFIAQWGAHGTGNGQFDFGAFPLTGVALDASGNVYVADAGNDRIQKFTGNGVYLAQWGTSGTGDGQFHRPTGLAVDADGNVYVADYWNCRVQVFTSGGVYLRQWGEFGVPAPPSNPGPQFAGVAVDPAGDIYVVDVHSSSILKFKSDGTVVTRIGASGTGDGQFYNPTGVAVDAGGNVYVTDYGNNRVQSFTSSGAYAHQWGVSGGPIGHLSGPTGVVVDGSGNIFVTDTGKHRMQKFTQPPTATSLALSSGWRSNTSMR
ncbi:MAG TPA: hypothetical protein VJN62_16565, partial [Gemmatimonadales bacterium]|nr:hypothetical protein [Gemmatimonadales bacterium]